MSTTMKKTLLLSLAIFVTIVGVVGVIYLVRKPDTIAMLPTPKPVDIFAVEVQDACTQTFVVACPSTSPSPSPSGSVSPSSSPSPSPSSSPPLASPSTPPSAALKCVSKKMYQDDSRNRAAFYYLEKEITDTNTISNGEVIIYNIITKNAGGNTVPDTIITDKLSTNLTYVDGDSGCVYDATTRVVTCTIGSLSSNSEAQRSFRAKVVDVTSRTSVANSAEITSTNGQRDSCSVQIDATGIVIVPPSPIPTALPEAGIFEVTAVPLGIGLLFLLAGALGLLLI